MLLGKQAWKKFRAPNVWLLSSVGRDSHRYSRKSRIRICTAPQMIPDRKWSPDRKWFSKWTANDPWPQMILRKYLEWSGVFTRTEWIGVAANSLHYNLLTYNVNVEPDEQTHKNMNSSVWFKIFFSSFFWNKGRSHRWPKFRMWAVNEYQLFNTITVTERTISRDCMTKLR